MFEGVNFIHLAQKSIQWLAFVNTMVELRVSLRSPEFHYKMND
jgi:hypothetical protein